MDYKERLLDEYTDLIIKKVKLVNIVEKGKEIAINDDKNEISKIKFNLLDKQLCIINEYIDILKQRLLLELNN